MGRMRILTTTDHNRDSAGMSYVYPVVSRRAGGVSVGVNLNVNNACNWRCIYCQVPDLRRGRAPPVDLDKLEGELREFLEQALEGDFLRLHAPPEARRMTDIALSGNGEPTSAREFEQVIERIARVMADFRLQKEVKLVLITNGSLIHHSRVQQGLRRMARSNGEVWFKIDRATAEGRYRVNGSRIAVERVKHNLKASAALCPTWVQTCLFALDGQAPARDELDAYLDLLAAALQEGISLRGVLLYGLARPSLQPEAPRLSPLPAEWLESFGREIAALGLTARVSV